MATAISAKDYHGADLKKGRTTSIWSRGFNRMIEARQRQANAMVYAYLATLDNETLESLGYTREELGNPGPVHWY